MKLNNASKNGESCFKYLPYTIQELKEYLEKQFASLALFPLVAYLDEDMQRYLIGSKQMNWLPFQKDFYGAYNAGDLFYETIDKLIENPQTPSIVLQMFYFFLKKGFLGKYRDSKVHIARYLEILRERIPVATPPESQITTATDSITTQRKPRIKKWHYYVGVVAASFFLWIILYFNSNYISISQ